MMMTGAPAELNPIAVSVIVPTRNRSSLLAMTLRSVLRQRDVDFEVIVVDEASTDDTAAVIAAFADPRIRVIRHETALGVSAARNHGATEARGHWLAFIDDDDLWAPDKLSRQLRAAREEGRDWVYTGAIVIGARGDVVRGEPPLGPDDVVAVLPRFNPIPAGGSNVVVRRTTWLEGGTLTPGCAPAKTGKCGFDSRSTAPPPAFRVRSSLAGCTPRTRLSMSMKSFAAPG